MNIAQRISRAGRSRDRRRTRVVDVRQAGSLRGRGHIDRVHRELLGVTVDSHRLSSGSEQGHSIELLETNVADVVLQLLEFDGVV